MDGRPGQPRVSGRTRRRTIDLRPSRGAPAVQLGAKLMALRDPRRPAGRLEQLLRNAVPPVIARIVDDRIMIDLRTVSQDEETELLKILSSLSASRSTGLEPAELKFT